MKLISSLNTSTALVKRYEQSILHKIISKRGSIDIDLATQVLGITSEGQEQYINELIAAASEEASHHI